MKNMVSVASLLNPIPPDNERPSPFSSQCPMLYSPEVSPYMPSVRKQKLCKGEATFIKGKPQEEVNYWPCEYQDEHVAAEHRKYQLYPMGHITEYCKHVPYRSEKKSMISKTGREGFHGNGATLSKELMWDYNNGLVRVTPFFKALEYPKTSPARMLGKNPGLKEICHSITGGSLAAQGYWMPFEAARAVAATFCYRIRYVLTPIFGLDFPGQCIPPGAPGFDSMHIAPKILRTCIEATAEFPGLHRVPKPTSRPETPYTGIPSWTPANVPPKASTPIDSESGYGTDTERSETYLCSPIKSVKSGFKRFETPRSVGMRKRLRQGCRRSVTSSPYGDESESSDDCRKRKRDLLRVGNDCFYDSSSTRSSKQTKRKEPSSRAVMTDQAAAIMLLELRLQDAALRIQEGETRKRRASA
ncbi:MAG: hypothetical protein Q9170_000301 [Blastenia crenularia]